MNHRRSLRRSPRATQPLPAFGRRLLEMRLAGVVPARHMGLGCSVVISMDSWKWGKAPLWYRLVITTEQDPAELDLSMVAGLNVVLVWSPALSMPARCDAAIKRLLAVEVATLRVINMADPHLGSFIKTEAQGIERTEYA